MLKLPVILLLVGLVTIVAGVAVLWGLGPSLLVSGVALVALAANEAS